MKRGSALLIVIGMLSFIVISAVSFAVYMRQSRLPSSYLRQKIAASQLVKAGLAEAMYRIDKAVGNDPFPGVGSNKSNDNDRQLTLRDGTEENWQVGNFWHNRIFFETERMQNVGYDNLSGTASSGGSSSSGTDFETAATLTLEALAYVPPPLINTVRYWSHHTPTASWSPLGYDAGRYAFTAVNVSDYLDVNRLRADAMRDSTAEGRLSLGWLFQNDDHTGPSASVSPAGFDAFVASATNDTFKTRFVSLADFNLALANKERNPGLTSPFCNYIESPRDDGAVYGDPTGWLATDARRMKFVTDSWYPGARTNQNAIVLTDLNDGQPFSGKENASLDDLQLINGSRCYKELCQRIDICAFGALYDYLDGDNDRYGHIPISLAIPTLERVPMLTGLCIEASGIQLKLKDNTSAVPSSTPTVQKKLHTWKVDSLGTNPKIEISACGVYPFKRKYGQDKTSYKLQVMVRGFFADYQLTDARVADGLLPGNGSKKDWDQDAAIKAPDKGWFTLVGEKNITVKDGPQTDADTVFDVNGLELSINDAIINGCTVYNLLETTTTTQNGTTTTYEPQEVPAGECFCYYKNGNNSPVREFGAVSGKDGPKLYLNYFVWARVLDGSDTVDLVPAMMSDDQIYNGLNTGDCGGDARKICGSRRPVIPLQSDQLTDFTYNAFVAAAPTEADPPQPQPQNLGKLSIYCDDPRFNYAPEDWYQKDTAGANSQEWLATARQRCQQGTHGGHDIFQYVSDAGYDCLQSLGELQFLPYLSRFGSGRGGVTSGGFYNEGKYDGKFATGPGDCANSAYAWQTHWAFGNGKADIDDGDDSDPYGWGILDTNGGPTVSPYSDAELMMVALGNTPYNWRLAYGDHGFSMADGLRYCFGPASSEAKMDVEDLEDIVAHIKAKIGVNQNWEEIWRDELDWDGEKFLGSQLGRDDLCDVDRKYLYSFWKNCFGNNQQLYLIFVRAEPAVICGDSAGHTPAQLGARAVALVWREPQASILTPEDPNSTPPHRMRILFYHEFQ